MEREGDGLLNAFNTNGTTIGTVQGVLAPSNQLQTIQLQVVDPAPSGPPQSKVQRVKTVTGGGGKQKYTQYNL